MTEQNKQVKAAAEMTEEEKAITSFMEQSWREINSRVTIIPYDVYINIAGFEIKTIHAEDEGRVLQFLRQNYYNDEPWNVVKEDGTKGRHDVPYHMSLIRERTSLVALQPYWVGGEYIKRVVGVAVARRKGPNEAQKLFQEAQMCGKTKWGETLAFLGHVARDSDVFNRYSVEKALHVYILAVAEEWRKLDVGERLLRALRHMCRKLGIRLITLDSTLVYVQHICREFEMDCVQEICYCDCKDKKGKNLFLSPRPTESALTYALKMEEQKTAHHKNARHKHKKYLLKYEKSIANFSESKT